MKIMKNGNIDFAKDCEALIGKELDAAEHSFLSLVENSFKCAYLDGAKDRKKNTKPVAQETYLEKILPTGAKADERDIMNNIWALQHKAYCEGYGSQRTPA